MDNIDFTNKYNTILSPKEEIQFKKWIKQQSVIRGRDFSKDLYDYDLKGYWKENQGKTEEGHFTDKYKKPNHPTFSNESIYHGKDNYQGGEWIQSGKQWSYKASPTNLKFYPPEELQMYFKTSEPDVNLQF